VSSDTSNATVQTVVTSQLGVEGSTVHVTVTGTTEALTGLVSNQRANALAANMLEVAVAALRKASVTP
jgi:hypothetical protein